MTQYPRSQGNFSLLQRAVRGLGGTVDPWKGLLCLHG